GRARRREKERTGFVKRAFSRLSAMRCSGHPLQGLTYAAGRGRFYFSLYPVLPLGELLHYATNPKRSF
ncbi:MAG: hypothetical protein ACUVRX_07435, partial [Actinomycetota bacterium]